MRGNINAKVKFVDQTFPIAFLFRSKHNVTVNLNLPLKFLAKIKPFSLKNQSNTWGQPWTKVCNLNLRQSQLLKKLSLCLNLARLQKKRAFFILKCFVVLQLVSVILIKLMLLGFVCTSGHQKQTTGIFRNKLIRLVLNLYSKAHIGKQDIAFLNWLPVFSRFFNLY